MQEKSAYEVPRSDGAGYAETQKCISYTSVLLQLASLSLLWALCLGRCLVLEEWQHQVFLGHPPDQLPSACTPPAAFVAQWPVFKDKGDGVEKLLGFCESSVSHSALEADLFIYPGVRQQP